MKNPNLPRNVGENNPMHNKKHSDTTKALMSKQQSLRMAEIRKIVYGTRSDQLSEKIRRIVKEVLQESHK